MQICEYIAEPSSPNVIADFKGRIKLDAPQYETWGDFEMAMAQKTKKFKKESDFIERVRDFKIYMVTYLEKEQQKFKQRLYRCSDNRITIEMRQSVYEFYEGIIPNIANMLDGYVKNADLKVSYISFNYTDTFDRLLMNTFGDPIGSSVMYKSDRVTSGTEAYTYLGTTSYIKHEGSRPMKSHGSWIIRSRQSI